MNRKVITIVGVIVLVLAVAGGSFYGGMLFQQWQVGNTQARFLANRGGAGNPAGGGAGGSFFGNGGAGNPASRGAFGQIKSIDGNTLILSTPQSEVTVTLSDATTIQKMVAGEHSDLQVGQTITVRGERDSSGNVAANDIQITANPQGQ